MPEFAPPDAATPCEDAFRGIAMACADALDAAIAVFLCSEDPAGPHKARVALRRLTTCLDAFAPLMRRKGLKSLRTEAKAIFRTLGAVRDSDVYLEDHADQPGHEDRLRKNNKLRENTRAALRKQKSVTFAPRLRRLVQPGSDLFRTKPKAMALRAAPLAGFAAQTLRQCWRDCLRHGLSVERMAPLERHDFRKDMKSLRYLAEFFASLFPDLSRAPFRDDFRDLQDALGVLNDFEVALSLAKGKRPSRLPPRHARAMQEAEGIWSRLSDSAPPWEQPDQPTR